MNPLTQELIEQVQLLLSLIEGTEASESETALEIRDLIYKHKNLK